MGKTVSIRFLIGLIQLKIRDGYVNLILGFKNGRKRQRILRHAREQQAAEGNINNVPIP